MGVSRISVSGCSARDLLTNYQAPHTLIEEEGGEMDEEITLAFFKSDVGLQALMDMFASTVKSLKRSECSHLILLPELP